MIITSKKGYKTLNIEAVLGQVVQRLRMSKMMTQEDLAFETELDRTYISLIERGKANPSTTAIFAISNALGTTPSLIFSEVEERLKQNGKNE